MKSYNKNTSWTFQLQNHITDKHFQGFINRDKWSGIKNNQSYIVNLDNSSGPGTHWVGVECHNNQILYFDPFAVSPFQELITNKYSGQSIHWNTQIIQSLESTSCGWFVVDFINKVRDLESFEQFINKWANDAYVNEQLVEEIFNLD